MVVVAFSLAWSCDSVSQRFRFSEYAHLSILQLQECTTLFKSEARSKERISNNALMEDVPLLNIILRFNECVTTFCFEWGAKKSNTGRKLPDLEYVP